MNTKESQLCDVTENRFRTVLLLLRIGGVPVNMKKLSLLISVYKAVMAFHSYALYLVCAVMNSFVHKHELKRFMKTFRSLIAASLVVWRFSK
jgi:hypothetical protein